MNLKSVDRTILVQSSNVDLGDVLPQYARTSILQVAGKYFGRLNTATVHFSKEGPMYRCTVNMQMGTLKMRSAEALHKDCYTAFRTALEKVAKQLRRAKRALREDKAERVDKDIILREPVRLRRKAARRTPEIQAVVDLNEYRMPRGLERKGPISLLRSEPARHGLIRADHIAPTEEAHAASSRFEASGTPHQLLSVRAPERGPSDHSQTN